MPDNKSKCSCAQCKQELFTKMLNKHRLRCDKIVNQQLTLTTNGQINEDYVICPVCKQAMTEINTAHLKKHNMDAKSFGQLFPSYQRICNKVLAKKSTLSGPSDAHKRGHTLEGFISKYGVVDGPQKYQAKLNSYWPKNLEGFITRYGELIGTQKYAEWCSVRSNAQTEHAYVSKYGEELGRQKWAILLNNRKKQNTLEGYITKFGPEVGRKKWFHKNLKNSQTSRHVPLESLDDYKLYCYWVDRYTTINKSKVHNIDLRSRHMHLDHKISKTYGFINNIPPYIIGHYHNLEIVTQKVNLSKNYRCSITFEELCAKIWA